MGLRLGCAIERRFKSGNHVSIRSRVRPRCTGRRHFTCAELAGDFFQRFGGIAGAIDVDRVEHEAGGLEPGVMAGDAVLVEERAGRKRVGRANSWSARLRTLSLHDGSHRRQRETERRKRSSQEDPSLNEKRGKSTGYRAGNGTASFSSSDRAALRMFFIA